MGDDYRSTPAAPLANNDRILDQAVLARADKALGKAPSGAGTAPTGGKTARTLFVASGDKVDELPAMRIYARDAVGLVDGNLRLDDRYVVELNSWDAFAGKLAEYKSIDRLVIYTHGTPGTLKIGSFKSLDEVAKEWTAAKRPLPVINDVIEFEGCNVAEGADLVVPFASLLRAPKFTAWNKYHLLMMAEIQVFEGNDAAAIATAITKALSPYQSYLVPNSPSPEKLKRLGAGKYSLALEWFRSDESEDRPDFGASLANIITFIPRRLRTPVGPLSISQTRERVQKLANVPDPPLEHWTVNIR